MQRILLAGAVGSGKGTMAKKILEHFDNFSIFCAGDVIRAQINSGTDFGKRARSFLEAGEHIPEAIVNDFLIEEISKKAAYSRLVLDGFPRSISQLAAVEKIAPVSLCIELEVPRKVIFERLAKRLVHGDSGRTYNQDYNPSHLEGKDDVTGENLMRRVDDTEEAIRRRLEVYAKTESKVAAYYKSCGVGVTIKGDSSDVIWPVVREHIEELLEPPVVLTCREEPPAAVLESVTPLTHNVSKFRFKFPQTDTVLEVPPGNHVILYAMIRFSGPRGHVEYKGRGTFLIKIGKELNRKRTFEEINMLVGGTGITPMIKIIKRHLEDNDSENKVRMRLLYANQSEDDVILMDELLEYAEKFPSKFSVDFTVSVGSGSWKFRRGRMNENGMMDRLDTCEKHAFLVCGPYPMVGAVVGKLRRMDCNHKQVIVF